MAVREIVREIKRERNGGGERYWRDCWGNKGGERNGGGEILTVREIVGEMKRKGLEVVKDRKGERKPVFMGVP